MTDKPTIEMTREEWLAWRAKQHPGPNPPPPAPRKSAYLYAYRQVIHLGSQAVYRAAVGDPKGVEVFLPPDTSDQDLGAKVHAALAASRFIEPDHPEWTTVMRFPTSEEAREHDKRVLAAAGVKTLKALRTGARHVGLTLRDGVISVEPWEQRSGGFWEPLDRSLTVTVPEEVPDEALGAAAREALARSR